MVAFLTTWSLSDGILQTWRNWYDPSKWDEMFEGSSDSGFTLERDYPEHTNLLFRRMTKLDLDPNEVAECEPRTFGELQKACALCDSYEKCDWNLTHSDDRAWQDYCPNAAALNILNAQQQLEAAYYQSVNGSGGQLLQAQSQLRASLRRQPPQQ